MDLYGFILKLHEVPLVNLANFMKFRVCERPRGCTKLRCIWTIETKALSGDPWFLTNLKSFIKSETGYDDSQATSVELESLRQAAESGDPVSQTQLADLYRGGYPPLSLNLTTAHHWYHQAALQDHLQAHLALGVLYELGMGVPPDPAKSFHWLSMAATQDSGDAQYKLGMCYEDGWGVDQDHVMALFWYQKAADGGDAIAQNNVGVYYDRGSGIQKNPKKAVYWYEKAAGQGHASAQNNLGVCYEEGVGVPPSPLMAVYWYQKAAEQGDQIAQNNLAYCYEHGNGVKESPRTAFGWYFKSAMQGYDIAQISVATHYYKGIGVTKDLVQAAHWYKKAADAGDEEAQRHLGDMYHHGEGVPVDYKAAFDYYTLSKSSVATQSLAEFKKGPLLNLLLAQEWPKSHTHLHQNCSKTILELFYQIYVEHFLKEKIPKELLTIIVKYIIQIWPVEQSHTPY